MFTSEVAKPVLTNLAKAIVAFTERVHRVYPEATIEPVDQVDDEDLYVDIKLPRGFDTRKADDELTRLALEIEREYQVVILTHTSRQ